MALSELNSLALKMKQMDSRYHLTRFRRPTHTILLLEWQPSWLLVCILNGPRYYLTLLICAHRKLVQHGSRSRHCPVYANVLFLHRPNGSAKGCPRLCRTLERIASDIKDPVSRLLALGQEQPHQIGTKEELQYAVYIFSWLRRTFCHTLDVSFPIRSNPINNALLIQYLAFLSLLEVSWVKTSTILSCRC